MRLLVIQENEDVTLVALRRQERELQRAREIFVESTVGFGTAFHPPAKRRLSAEAVRVRIAAARHRERAPP